MAARLWWAGPVGSRHPPPRMAGASSFASTADRFGAHQPLCKCARRWHRVLASNALTGGTPSPGQALTKPGSSVGRHSMTFAAACALLAPRSATSVAPQNPGVRSGQRRSPFCRERAAARPRRPIPAREIRVSPDKAGSGSGVLVLAAEEPVGRLDDSLKPGTKATL